MKTDGARAGLQASPHLSLDRNPPLPAYSSRLARDLRRAVAGGVDFGAQARALYSYDASVFRQVPIGVVLPRDAADVEAALACCREHGAPVLGRGTGSSLAGQSVNEAVVFDFSKYMNAIVELDPERRRARVQPGVICDELRDAAEAYQLTFGPDPATHDHATFGGMIGNNSCGTQALRQGTPNRNRIALQMVKDLLDESTFAASPGHVIPGKLGQAVSGIAGKLRDRADDEHPG